MEVIMLGFWLALAFVGGFFTCAAVASGKVREAEEELGKARREALHEQSEHFLARQEVRRWRDKFRALAEERGRHG